MSEFLSRIGGAALNDLKGTPLDKILTETDAPYLTPVPFRGRPNASYLIPHTAVCDPELTLGCPPALTASAGADALSHGIEAFTAVRRPV